MEKSLADYYKEEEGYDLLSTDKGFFAYRYLEDSKSVYVGHFAVAKDERNNGGFSELFGLMVKMAKDIGAKCIIGDVFRNEFNKDQYTNKLLMHIKYGYKVVDVNKDCITMLKEV